MSFNVPAFSARSALTAAVSRRSFLIGSSALAATQIGAGRALAQGSDSAGSFLAVADTANSQLSIYTLPDLERVGVLEDIVVATHAGFLPLPTGELLFVDEAANRLIQLGVVNGEAVIVGEAPVPTGISHFAIDSPTPAIVAVGSGDTAAPVTIVDLATWEATPVPLIDTGEVGLALTAEVLFHRNDVLNRLEAYSLADLVTGNVSPVSTVEIGAFGHGESINQANGLIYCATDDGIDVVRWDGEALNYVTTHPWNENGEPAGRGYFQRLSLDGSLVISYISNRSAPQTEWETWTNFAMIVDTTTGEILRPELGNGYVFRFGLATDRALYYRMGGEGDEVIELDLDRASSTFGEIARRTAITAMSGGPEAGAAIFDVNQYRAVAITADGTLGFVTRGGDGIVDVLDLTSGEVSGEISTPSNLDGGGYLAVFGTTEFTDTIAR